MASEGTIVRRTFKEFGEHLVADPRICHGKWTFRGTRIFVHAVLDQLAEGMEWKEISRQWRGRVSAAAISETILLAKNALFENGAAIEKSVKRVVLLPNGNVVERVPKVE